MANHQQDQINIGVIGYGMSAKIFHIPFIHATPTLRLAAIVQRNPQPGSSSAVDDHPSIKHYTSAPQLLADASIHAVIITTPPGSHFELTKAALEAGKHVLTEKPFVPSSKEAEQLQALAKEKGKLVCVYQNRRWDSDFLAVKKLIQDKTLGRILEMYTHFDRFRPDPPVNWKGDLPLSEGGSALYDLGTHLFDQAYVLFGMPQSVHGRLLNQRSGQPLDLVNPDAVVADLSYPDGLLVRTHMSVLSAEMGQPRIWLRGDRGTVHKRNLDPQEDQLKAGLKPTDPGFGEEDTTQTAMVAVVDEKGQVGPGQWPKLVPETYLAFYRGLAKALASGKEEDLPVKAGEAIDVLRIIEAVIESAKTGRDIKMT